ncbi:hypothetical protein [Blastococcus aggregatus]|uniref:hypothetical protein n=1 Tax=Blastococcus aggregatus TaxID=38502 RepID=UPI000BE399A7|nr:hypothetical protein [Blastococcus aggregatus]
MRVSGPACFTIVGIHTAAFPGSGGYEGEIDQAIDWIQDLSDVGPILLAGDFNSPISTSQRRYDKVAQRLTDMGLCDVYQTARGLERGEEPTEPTYYQSRLGEVRGFHIDHIWLPVEWADGAAVHVGDHDTWIASGLSDHAPVVADVHIGY